MISIFIGIEVDNDLTVADVWPDGDQPEHPTAEDVAALLMEGGLQKNLRDWSLLEGATVNITVSDQGTPTTTKRLFVP